MHSGAGDYTSTQNMPSQSCYPRSSWHCAGYRLIASSEKEVPELPSRFQRRGGSGFRANPKP